MRKVVYQTECNGYVAKTLRELRSHVQFFNQAHKCNDYDGDHVFRYIIRKGRWECDGNFLVRINVVNGKVIFRRVVAGSVLPF